MNAWVRKKASSAELVKQYALEAMRYEKALMDNVNTKKITDDATRIASAIYDELQKRLDGLETFQGLITHDSPTVKFWVAHYMLEFNPDQALPLLEALAREAPFDVSFKAQMVLTMLERDNS
jgi:hypothetical protein